eukprot:TRINITY_DN89109_c0_g1_i1.p2 TRINITY_DN89109_c0_g1~~TRINITY_DN89109_c0_g1_i1.p2  ORF type:complete len:203 (+),score=15.54 TRINITY_DN89109_c0_g1_i1:143-751(+)
MQWIPYYLQSQKQIWLCQSINRFEFNEETKFASMKYTFFIFVALFFSAAVYGLKTCTSGKTTYKLIIVDATVTEPGCTYAVNITNVCPVFAGFESETSTKEVCFSKASTECTFGDDMVSYSIVKCGNSYSMASLPRPQNADALEEITLSNSHINVKGYLNMYCDGVSQGSPRTCTPASSFAAGLGTGMAAFLAAAMVLFALL